MRHTETILQEEIAWRLKPLRPDCLVVPIPNSIHIPAHTEQELYWKRIFIARMKRSGQLRPGAFDFVVLWRDGCGGIELKRPAERTLLGRRSAGRPSPAQREFEAECQRIGVRHAYAHSWDEVHATLVEWGRLQ